MCNCNSCGCSLWNALYNLFDTSSWNNGCGCGNSNSYNRGFVNGVNTASELVGNNGGYGCGCGCGCGCGSNGDLSAYTACGNQCYDPYYAAQYGLYGCGCNGNLY